MDRGAWEATQSMGQSNSFSLSERQWFLVRCSTSGITLLYGEPSSPV